MNFHKTLTSLAGLTCLFALLACSAPTSSKENNLESAKPAIVGGAAVNSADIVGKSTVAILISVFDTSSGSQKENQYLCTGSLLRSGIVLTAAHCVPPKSANIMSRMYVVFTTDLNTLPDSDVRVVTETVVHPQFGQSGPHGEDSNDLALLKFMGGLPPSYRTARLLPNDSLLKSKMLVTLAGYGVNDADAGTTDNQLNRVEVPFGVPFGDTEIILDQTDGRGACHGDSGGPAFVTIKGSMFLWGVISRGLGDDNCRTRGVYTKINAQMNFITTALSQLGASTN